MDPMTGMMVLQTGLQIFGALQGQDAAEADAERRRHHAIQQAKMQSTIAEGNIGLLNRRADDVERIAGEQSDRYLNQISYMIGRQKVVQASAGVNINSASASMTRARTAQTGQRDSQTIRNNAWRQAFSLRTRGINMRMRAQAGMDYAQTGGDLAVAQAQGQFVPNMLATAANIGSQWTNFYQSASASTQPKQNKVKGTYTGNIA